MVTVASPRVLHGKLGTKLKRLLNADSRATANIVKWAVFAELKVIIDRAGRDVPQGDNLIREALELATHRVTVRTVKSCPTEPVVPPRLDRPLEVRLALRPA
jgi:hypothetical protein